MGNDEHLNSLLTISISGISNGIVIYGIISSLLHQSGSKITPKNYMKPREKEMTGSILAAK